ncbi:MAG: hypothetical protein HWD60_14745 [Defluviicoccus sp.]|nr:MAG: hypothetical protein HWD60_14745 [Defluviicoccus sp.]
MFTTVVRHPLDTPTVLSASANVKTWAVTPSLSVRTAKSLMPLATGFASAEMKFQSKDRVTWPLTASSAPTEMAERIPVPLFADE